MTSHTAEQTIRVLFIDDDIHIHKLADVYFKNKNYRLIHAEDVTTGIATALSEPPDVIVCDVELPDQKGFDLVQHLQNHSETNAIPMILISGNSDSPYMREAGRVGADTFLPKPFAMSELEEVILTRVRRLQSITHQLNNKLSTLRSNIAYSLPHELRTPLSNIKGYAGIMGMHAAEVEDSLVEKFSQSVLVSAERLERLVENHLLFTRLKLIETDVEQRAKLREDITHTLHIIKDCATLTVAAKNREGDLNLDLSETSVHITGSTLDKIIYELVDNALKFSPPGTPIDIQSGTIGNQFILTVRDYGFGMDKAQISSIDAYMQFDRATREQQGVGLGLAIVKQIAKLHDGQFDIQSDLDEGTLVRIRLPL